MVGGGEALGGKVARSTFRAQHHVVVLTARRYALEYEIGKAVQQGLQILLSFLRLGLGSFDLLGELLRMCQHGGPLLWRCLAHGLRDRFLIGTLTLERSEQGAVA